MYWGGGDYYISLFVNAKVSPQVIYLHCLLCLYLLFLPSACRRVSSLLVFLCSVRVNGQLCIGFINMICYVGCHGDAALGLMYIMKFPIEFF